MKFLVLARSKPGAQVPENPLEVTKAALQWVNERKEKGLIDDIYQIVPHGGVAIVDYDSAESLYKDLTGYPLISQFLIDVKPLVDVKTVLEQSIEMYS